MVLCFYVFMLLWFYGFMNQLNQPAVRQALWRLFDWYTSLSKFQETPFTNLQQFPIFPPP
jgi:hypothetical protein